MAKRKSKKPQQEDTSILLDSSVPQSKRRINSSAFSPALLFIIIFTVGASIMGWFCVQQQYSIDEMSESFTTMQKRISNLQQVMLTTDPQSDAGFGVEERIFALEEAQKQAEEKAKVALATSEKLKNSEVYSQLLALHDEMDIRLAEMKQVSVSVTTLQAMFKNQSEQFEAMKRSVAAGLSSSLALAQNVAGLTDAVTSASSRADKQTALVESLNAQLEGQASELDELKESMELHSAALDTNNQEISAIKELVETKQTLRAQALEEMLNSVQMTLDEQFFTSQTLHSSVMAQLQTFYTQLANAPAWSKKLKSNEEEIISTTAQKTSEVQEKLEDDEEEAEQEDAEDDAEQEAKEEEVMHPLEQEEEEEEDFTEEQDEEDITEEEEEITEEEEDETTEEEEEILEDEEETTEEKEILEDEEETTEEEEEILEDEEDEDITEESEEEQEEEEEAEEEDTEETDDVLDESLEEEEVFEEEEESWETEEEESADDFMDENEGDE